MEFEKIPKWAWFQNNIGIHRMMSVWQCESWLDEDGVPRHGIGLLYRFKPMAVEHLALENISRQAELWQDAGRLNITPLEQRVWELDCEYMRRCQTPEFRKEYPLLAQADYNPTGQDDEDTLNLIAEDKHIAWIASRTGMVGEEVRRTLAEITRVCELREALGMDGEPEIDS